MKNIPENIGIEIRAVQVREHYELVNDMMRGLHESELELFNKTDKWENIADNYMRHVMEMQEENEGTCLVAFVEDRAAGFIFGYIEEEEDSRIETYTGKELYVSDGYVYPEFRKLGIYRKLNESLEEIYINKGVRRILRFTLTSNTRMQKFLEHEGYQATRLLYEKWLGQDGKTVDKLDFKLPKD